MGISRLFISTLALCVGSSLFLGMALSKSAQATLANDAPMIPDHEAPSTMVPDAATINTGFLVFPSSALWPHLAIESPPSISKEKEPLGVDASHRVNGGLSAKWLQVQRALAGERQTIEACRTDNNCTDEALRFLNLLERAKQATGHMRIREINRTVNLTIRSASDAEVYGVEEFWATPLMTLKQRAGDCEDIAIVKYLALLELGFAENDLRLVVIHETNGGAHVVTAVRDAGRWLLLDNRQLSVIETLERTEHALFILDREGARTALRSAKQNRYPHS